jgi:O-antigen/teichoic acid export membrane protein
LGSSLSLLPQSAALILLARLLPVKDVGLLVALSALTSILGPFVGFGAGNLFIRNVSRNPKQTNEQWEALVGTTLYSALLFSLVAITTARVFVGAAMPIATVTAVVMGELLFSRWIQLVGQAYQATERFRRVTEVNLIASCTKLAAVFMLLLLAPTARSISTYALLYLVSSFVAAVVVLAGTPKLFGAIKRMQIGRVSDLKEGLLFAVSPCTQIVNNDADKLILSRFTTPEDCGIYGIVYRILAPVYLPVGALLTVTYPVFFRKGQEGIRHNARFALELLPIALGYTVVAGFLLLGGAKFIPLVLGQKYASSVPILRQLSFLPMLKAIQYLFADTLTGADQQRTRVALQLTIAALNVLGNIALVPHYGLQAAVWTTLVCDGTLALLFVAASIRLAMKTSKPQGEAALAI